MKVENHFAEFAQYFDLQKGHLNFDGHAVVHSAGVDFSGGSSFRISAEDFEEREVLGSGNYGTVFKVLHKPTKVNMALKEIRLELDKNRLEAIVNELEILNRCHSPNIVQFFGAFFIEGGVYICMEYMDAGSLASLYHSGIDEPYLAKIALAVVKGLSYLKKEHNVMHRDIKPTNILLSTTGEIKLCDFGVSKKLVASLARTNIGCQPYMAPERIFTGNNADGSSSISTYNVQADVWSLGLSLLEAAIGKYPYLPEVTSSIFAQLTAIVRDDSPELPADRFSKEAVDFCALCLKKDSTLRPSYSQLLEHAWLVKYTEIDVNMVDFVLDRLNKTKT
ncbi:hypothetical protein CANCADRAFT_26957 [Tortispora caseinolytica NRRL Y-17796]|uniref:mitogen-activated protein kinase kinase n=1 Tax=Tortispora caseinolytica NRRL Y-17796 TaxID=767744 RepID=A0A1E4TCT4_9ASCO|nr:hypothetical protein CANCADRAFT_26957 [Tortispora caseinolytica NRRL Y-17796]